MKTERYIRMAKSIAQISEANRQKMGCVVEYKGHVINFSVNSNKTHPLQKEYNKFRFDDDSTPHSLHAEIAALAPLRNADIDWNRVNVYIFRIRKDTPHHGGLARPCKSCMAYLKDLGIKNIYYSTEYGYVHEVIGTEELH